MSAYGGSSRCQPCVDPGASRKLQTMSSSGCVQRWTGAPGDPRDEAHELEVHVEERGRGRAREQLRRAEDAHDARRPRPGHDEVAGAGLRLERGDLAAQDVERLVAQQPGQLDVALLGEPGAQLVERPIRRRSGRRSGPAISVAGGAPGISSASGAAGVRRSSGPCAAMSMRITASPFTIPLRWRPSAQHMAADGAAVDANCGTASSAAVERLAHGVERRLGLAGEVVEALLVEAGRRAAGRGRRPAIEPPTKSGRSA